MKVQTNSKCAACPLAYNAINGRYCNQLHQYVEYAKSSPCNH